jgi:hypothetical protein
MCAHVKLGGWWWKAPPLPSHLHLFLGFFRFAHLCGCVICLVCVRARVMRRQRRIDAGALTLASAEVRFMLDSETHDPLDVAAYQMRQTNELVCVSVPALPLPPPHPP